MEKLFEFQTSSKFDKSFENLINSDDFQKLNSKFEVKPFYLKYKGLKRFLSGFTFLIQTLTIAVSFICIASILSPLMNQNLSYFFSGLILIGIEFGKRLSFSPTVKDYLQFSKISIFNALIASILLCVSLWLTWNGGHDTVFAVVEKPTLLNADSLTNYERQRIGQLTNQLSDVKKTQSWKSVLTAKGQKTYNKITEQIAKLEDKISDKEKKTQIQNKQTNDDFLLQTNTNATRFRFITVVLDLMLFLLLGWLEYYDYRSFTEFAKLNTAVAEKKYNSFFTDNDNRSTINVGNNFKNENLNEKRVVVKGFKTYDDEPKDITTPSLPIVGCQNCGSNFERKAPRHIFCSDICRVDSWEQRTGKRIKKSI
jgi:hypothetical protein